MTPITPAIKAASELHDEAMELAELGLSARSRGDLVEAERRFAAAYAIERRAVDLIASDHDLEPTRSIMLRSAATLAFNSGLGREAEQLVGMALAGRPPGFVREELLDLIEEINFRRHLGLKGLELAPEDVQLSISGREAPPGLALSEEFVGRVQTAEKIIIRGIERLMNRPFREAGQAIKEIADKFRFYLSAPRPASFAVTLKLGRPMRQLGFPQLEQDVVNQPEKVVDNVMECLATYSRGDEKRLKELIPQEPYYRNFVGLADKLVPDGERINVVGLTSFRDGQEVTIALSRPPRPPALFAHEDEGEAVSVVGRLLFASATTAKSQKIKVVDDKGAKYEFSVPEGMMADIVKPLWEDRVLATGFRRGKQVWLDRIHESPE